MRNATRLLGLAALVAAGVSCGDVVRQGSSPVFLAIDLLQGVSGAPPSTASSTLSSDVITNRISPAPCTVDLPCPTIFGDGGTATLRAPLKDIGLAPTSNNDVTINRVRVEYTRADGRNTQGVDVPFAFDTSVTGTIQAGGTLTLGFVLVREGAKEEAPLAQLRAGGFISATATVTFFGVDRVGNAIQVTGRIQIDFRNFVDS
jgi:hypothetical protein